MIDAYDLAKSCASKNAYPSEDKAREVALDCWRERRVWLRAYACPMCGMFHLTRSNAAPVMKPGWRPPAKSQRALARERRRRRMRR